MEKRDFEKILDTLRELSMFIYELAQEDEKKALKKRCLFSFDEGNVELGDQTRRGGRIFGQSTDRGRPFRSVLGLVAGDDGIYRLPDDSDRTRRIFGQSTDREDTPADAGEKVVLQSNNSDGSCVDRNGAVKKKEIDKMLLDIQGLSINSKPRKDGRFQGYYMSCGVKRYIYGKSFEDVEKKLKRLLRQGLIDRNIERYSDKNKTPILFDDFVKYFFEKFRKKKVAEKTYTCDLSRYKLHLKPIFQNKPIKRITPDECQDLLDELNENGKYKTAEEISSLLSIIFKGAIAHGVIERNPMDIVVKETHEREHGTPLTDEEIRVLKEKLKGTYCEQTIMLLLYTGLRPNEMVDVKIDGEFIVARNSKRKRKKVEYKKIPITEMLAPYLAGGLTISTPDYVRRVFKEILPDHKLYDLRTTFNTRCQECGVSDVARKTFMGHSLGKLDDAYTKLSDNYLITEAKKIRY